MYVVLLFTGYHNDLVDVWGPFTDPHMAQRLIDGRKQEWTTLYGAFWTPSIRKLNDANLPTLP